MKTFLTIRGNLLLINLVVISLILWLAISFLHIAATQRQEALLLQGSMSTEATISRISEALTLERLRFSDFLNSAGNTSQQHRAHLKGAILETDTRLDVMTTHIANLMSRPGFDDNIPATTWSLLNRLDRLELHRNQLSLERQAALDEVQVIGKKRHPDLYSGLFDTQARIQEDLISLARSVKYLPSVDAASVAIYQTLLNQILIANIDLARKQQMLSNRVSDDADLPMASSQSRVLSEKIEQRLAHLVTLALASDKADQLFPIATSVESFYQKQYRPVEQALRRVGTSTGEESVRHSDWQFVTSELSRLISQLANTTHASIEILANQSASRATRNLIIDALLVALCFLITLASVMISRRVKQHAYQDSLTQLANRLNFETTLLETKASDSQQHAVIFLDLDRFKSINDNYGHSVGDELLIEVAERLKANCKPTELLARLGGDEFSVLVRDIESEDAVEALAVHLVETIEQVITIRDLNLKVGASAGISIAPQDCNGGVELLRNADIAMYHSKSKKSTHSSRVFRFNQGMAASYQQRLVLEQDLKKAFENNQFHLAYQPKVCTRSGKVKSVEALLRWSHPERGLISPAEFIPVAEDTGLMGGIGDWVLNEACREISRLQKGSLPDLQVAVNISAQQFGDEHFVDRVLQALQAHDLSYSSLSLEVTESIVMTDIKRVINMLKTLQDLGISIAVDDFGTGYSSLQYLQELPLNTLKIDRAFIIALDDISPHSSVANSIVQMAALFNLETVAEGVESLEQEMKVRSLGVDHIQGYRYSRPVLADELAAVVVSIGEQHAATDAMWGDRAA